MVEPQPLDVPKTPTPPAKPKKSWRGFFLFLFFLLVSASALSYYLWKELTHLQEEIQRQTNPLAAQVTQLHNQLQIAQNSILTLEKRLGQFSQEQQRLDNDVAVIAHQVQNPQDKADWIIPEVLYLLTIANHRLLLAQEPDEALAALQAADERLQRLANPLFLEVRTKLTEDISKLQQLPHPDIEGLAVRLAHFVEQVDNLPLLQGGQLTKTTETKPRATSPNMTEALWGQLKQLVVIRYSTEAGKGLLTEEQRYFVGQTLRLRLETARFCLLRHDSKNFTTSLQTARDWLNHYYDQNDKQVKALQEDLAKMQNTVLDPKLPNISGSLTLLKRLSNTLPVSTHPANENINQ